MGASATRTAYAAFSTNFTADYSIVIDQNGIIQYRGDGVDITAITDIIDGLLVMDIADVKSVPEQFVLEQNYPNPFNPSTMIRFNIDKIQKVNLRIYNNEGKLIRTVIDGRTGSGSNEVTWDGRNESGQPVSSGVYFYELQGETSRRFRKMMLIR